MMSFHDDALRRFDEFRRRKVDGFESSIIGGGADFVQPLLFVHICPVYFSEYRIVDIDLNADQMTYLRPPGVKSFYHAYNADGLLIIDDTTSERTMGVTHFFRNGRIEAVRKDICRGNDGSVTIHAAQLEKLVVRFVSRALRCFSGIDVFGPYFVSFSLFRINGARIETPSGAGHLASDSGPPIEKNVLHFPICQVESFEQALLPGALTVSFDALWQAGGQPRWREMQ